MRRFVAALIVAAIVPPAFVRAAHADLTVVATLPDLAAIAAEVGGEHVTVTALASSRQDPHFVDARPSYLVSLSRADVLIANGLELEIGWLPPLQTQARNPHINVGGAGYLTASAHVPTLLEVSENADRSMGDVHPGGNPHLTISPVTSASIAIALSERFANLDPANAAVYSERGARFAAELNAFAEEQRARFAALSADQRQYVAYHKSLVYLADWLQLTEITTIEPMPGVTPSPGRVAEVLDRMRSTGVGVIIQEEFYPRNTSETLARLASAELVVLPGGTRFDDGQAYIDHCREIADALYAAMSR